MMQCRSRRVHVRMLLVLLVAMLVPGPRGVRAQVPAEPGNGQPAPAASGDDVMQPTELGIRLTPGMARVFGREAANNWLGRAYGVEGEARQQAADRIARQIMATAHKNQEAARGMLEYAFESLVENHGRFTPETGKKWAELSRPMIPGLREFMTNVAEDLRPLIPPAKQIQFAGDMAKASLGIDLYEKKMDRWAEGKVREHENPFDARDEGQDRPSARDDTGEPPMVRHARQEAEATGPNETRAWQQYVREAIDYYGLDAAQQKTAESMLRELEDRARQTMSDDWKAKVVSNRTRRQWGMQRPKLSRGPWMWQIEREYDDLIRPLREMRQELKARLETLPTEAQRAAAEAAATETLAKLTTRAPAAVSGTRPAE